MIDNDSSDNFRTIINKKLIHKRKSGSLVECLNYGIKMIRKINPNSYIFRLDADEKIIDKKKDNKLLKKLIINSNSKAFSVERDIFYKNKPISKDLKQQVIRIFHCQLEYEKYLIMDEYIKSDYEILNSLQIVDYRSASLSDHFKRHLIYASREYENYFINKKNNFKYFKKNKKFYYILPPFLRSFIFGFFSIFKVRFNKNFIYNFIYQIIRTLIYRLYVDYLILKKK